MDDKRWIELAKRRKQDKYFGIISLLIVLMMVFFTLKNIGWLLTFIVVAVILYYWVDVEQMLEDSKAINRTQKIIFIILVIIYVLTSIVFAFIILYYFIGSMWNRCLNIVTQLIGRRRLFLLSVELFMS